MFKFIVAAIAVTAIFSSQTQAAPFSSRLGIGFSAPNVNGTTNASNPQTGDIIFDTNNNSFQGYGGSGLGWLSLGSTSSTLKVPVITTYTSGTGAYTAPTSPAPLYIRVRMVGGGGGGASSGTTAVAGAAGGNTTFGSLLTAGGGTGAAINIGTAAAGGIATIAVGATGTAIVGGFGGAAQNGNTGTPYLSGGAGGTNPFGGAGGAGVASTSPTAGVANTGAGGGGGGINAVSSWYAGGGGGAGGFVGAIIPNPTGSYSYVVGTAGAGGTASGSGYSGASGGTGYIEVTEYYQ